MAERAVGAPVQVAVVAAETGVTGATGQTGASGRSDAAGRSRPTRHPLVGLGVALVSAAAFATSGAFGKSLLVGGWSPGAVVTMRITLAALVLLVPALWSLRGRWAALRRNAWVVVGYGLTGVAGCQLAYFNAVTHLSVGVALLLEYLAPVLIVGWLWARHGQAPRRLTVAGVALALAGLLLVLDVVGGASVSLVGVLWGLGAAVCLVLYFLLADHVDDDVPAARPRRRRTGRRGALAVDRRRRRGPRHDPWGVLGAARAASSSRGGCPCSSSPSWPPRSPT